MIPNNYKTSIRIPSQLPEFIRDDLNYETFVAFVQAYYEWMELPNTANAQSTIVTTSDQGVTTGAKNLTDYFDVDQTINAFVNYFINDFLPYFPENSLSDQRKVLKIAKQLYETKGTKSSYELLFRLLYNSSVNILETRDLVFRASDGNWYVPKLLKVKTDNELWLTPAIQNLRVFGETSKSFANIDQVLLNVTKYDVYISDIERLFQSGETVRIVDVNNQDVYVFNGQIVSKDTPGSSLVTGKLVGSISDITINPANRGSTYNIGDPVVVYGGLNSVTGLGAAAFVQEVTAGSIQRIYVTDGGYGYRPGKTTTPAVTNYSNTTIGFTPTHGALAHVGDFNSLIDTTVSLLPSNLIALKEHVVLSSSSYNFLNMASANTNTKLLDAFSFQTFETYPISTVVVDNGGGGFTQLPVTTATSNFYDAETGTPQNLAEIGILAPLTIVNGGIGYHANDRIIFIGGSGVGASANVKSVDAFGTITETELVPYMLNDQIYPTGGMCYKLEEVKGTGVSPLYAVASSSANTFNYTGHFNPFETVIQKPDLVNITFSATVTGYDSTKNLLKIVSPQGTLEANTLLIGVDSGATINVRSSIIVGTNSIIQPSGILGDGAEFYLVTDRIGSVTKIGISQYGEDYISAPKVSLKVQDLCVTGITNIDALSTIIPGALIFQGQDIDNSQDGLDVDAAPYSSYVDSISLLNSGETIANNIYNLRVYNYYGKPVLFDPLNSANTVIQIDTEIEPYPTMILNTSFDVLLGYKNGYKTYGDGNAKATAKFLNGLIIGQGQYLDSRGQPSSYAVLQSKLYNDYTYQLSVEVPISQYREALKSILHPSGMNIVGLSVLNSQESLNLHSHPGFSTSLPLYHFDSNASVNVITNFTSTSNSIVTFDNITSVALEGAITTNNYIYITRENGPNVYSKVLTTDYTNTQITIDPVYLTYNNVAYGYANASSNLINITAETTAYDMVNNGNYSSEATNNHLKDIIFAGDLLKVNGTVYTVNTVSYGTYANSTIVTLEETIINATGNCLISVNRNIYYNQDVIIYTAG